ncbi:hypothetical protein Amet_1488 [Alkaliphilus metalliredigens QYMF]|uniref:Uncharacterized protein n=1 Tax=Alkaliphilus metalliredigens (strain QYMF) TaxID=293826 RepID=A6TNB6_ALKMQ|nr:hypothetical protein [Alkaliphilus metalliredigens]ABR47684.1 hypothetical protein Amet_1488 [Alkaliphilus metalliredigens QYMF]
MNIEVLIEFLDAYNLPWLLLAIISWLAIYFSCSLQQFFHALPVAIWTMIVGGILEKFFIDHKFWIDRFILIPVGELDLFVIIGPFFCLGLLLIRFLPKDRSKKCLLILLFSALSTIIEALSIELGFLEYRQGKWSALHSLVAYTLGLMSALGFYYVYYSKRISNSKYH